MNSLRRLGFICVFLVLTGFVLSFFGKPTVIAPVSIVDPSKELNAAEFKGFTDSTFGDKVVNSTWAMVLVHSEFSNANASGLESLRNWAKQKFTLDRQFLSPIVLPSSRASSTVLSSLTNSLFGLPIKLADLVTSSFLKWRIEQFHKSNAYQSFRVDFYELFGANQESVKLLFRYQEERAKESLSVVQSFFFWLVTVTVIGANYFRMLSKNEPSGLRQSLACFWAALATFYLLNACISNSVEVLAGSCLSSIIAIYLAFPIAIERNELGSLTWMKYELSARAQVILLWLTLSLCGIQVINWIKGGILTNPDSITLLVGAFTGNFVHDPIGIKRGIVEAVGMLWLLLTVWTIYFYKSSTDRSQEIETKLKSLGKQKVSIQ